MVFGLFKSKKARQAEKAARSARDYLKTVERYDQGYRAEIALTCAKVRLAEMNRIAGTDPEHADQVRQAWYDPLKADTLVIAMLFGHLKQIKDVAEHEVLKATAKGDEAEQVHWSMLVDALETWSQTWLACLQPDLRPTVVETWGLIAAGFPLVEAKVAAELAAAGPHQSEKAIAVAKQTIADGPDGPEYRRIPLGFAPKSFNQEPCHAPD